ncbi:putative Lipopolysaccharide heptosyltransferase II [Nitrospira japonica]|uniref:Putative Lipopolysaccharide heptosyltransferase II n=1 Tax=Nitrospira japonica TaxID=1325564 RepID=A0A1W1HZH8_9BACT|nr:glycosyltransferase family 9 protein [Nitrospira japonica]SLM46180.1 putative Lipopolysaccharide heptosyltransferase II [Nitrospira japonica]
MKAYQHILFIKPSSLGDIVHAMPALAAVRRAHPGATVGWLVKRQWAGLVERIDGVDHLWEVEPGVKGWLSLVPALRADRFDLAIDLQGLFRSAAMARLSGVPERIGFANAREGSPWFYTRHVPVPHPNMHAVDRYLLVAKALGADEHPAEFKFRIPHRDHETVDRALKQAGWTAGERFVAVNVSARWPTKRWPVASFAALSDLIVQRGIGSVLFIGGPNERAEVAQVKALMKARSLDLCGALPVGLLPALLGRADLLVTNDSGPMHVAAAVGTPVAAMFGPTSPLCTGPYGAGHGVLMHPVPCSPCFSRTCSNSKHLACLTDITVDRAFSVVASLPRRSAQS